MNYRGNQRGKPYKPPKGAGEKLKGKSVYEVGDSYSKHV